MAIIYTYPTATPKATDKLIGTVTEDVNAVNVVKGNPTRSFNISAIQSLFNEDVVSVVVPVTATVFKTLTDAAPITLLTAPGAGKAYVVDRITLFVDAGSIAFNSSQDPYINGPYTNTGITFPKGSTVLASTTDVLYTTQLSFEGDGYILQQNTALTLNANSGTTTTGTGMLYFNITYKTVNTSSTMV